MPRGGRGVHQEKRISVVGERHMEGSVARIAAGRGQRSFYLGRYKHEEEPERNTIGGYQPGSFTTC